ncbi:MAG: phosphate acetyltransferase [Candidatus Omnitrophica bacterium]|nr:phosphate acetyltransferase [Candidatus Omnitrophota bacterium]
MGDVLSILREKAKRDSKTIVLPEGEDKRVQEAVSFIVREKIAKVFIFDKKGELHKLFKEEAASDCIKIIDLNNGDIIKKYASLYFELRKAKGISLEVARKIVKGNPVFIASLMVGAKEADGFVAGASLSTSDVARAAIHCIKKKEGVSTVMGVFIMVVPDCTYGEKGLFVFADCGVVPEPDDEQLAEIAIETADFTKDVLEILPKVALLSYSTKGSSKGENIDKIVNALEIVKRRRPDLLIDGELQVDAAIVPEVAKIKFPHSPVAGYANVLIFPNLEAGNCGYKLVQRMAKAKAVGPLFLGLESPASDLSRGCDVDDIIDAVAVTAVRAQKSKICTH